MLNLLIASLWHYASRHTPSPTEVDAFCSDAWNWMYASRCWSSSTSMRRRIYA